MTSLAEGRLLTHSVSGCTARSRSHVRRAECRVHPGMMADGLTKSDKVLRVLSQPSWDRGLDLSESSAGENNPVHGEWRGEGISVPPRAPDAGWAPADLAQRRSGHLPPGL